MEKRKWTDTDRLDSLQELTDRSGAAVICRWSTTGRGWRLHELGKWDGHEGFNSVRKAIDAFVTQEERRVPAKKTRPKPAD